MSLTLDAADYRILNALQRDSSQSIAHIAEAAGLSKSACHRRIKILEEAGCIERYAARLDLERLGYELSFIVELSLEGQSEQTMERFEREVLHIPEVLECTLMTGENDYVLRVVARNVKDYERIHHRIAKLPGIVTIKSSLALRTVKAGEGLILG